MKRIIIVLCMFVVCVICNGQNVLMTELYNDVDSVVSSYDIYESCWNDMVMYMSEKEYIKALELAEYVSINYLSYTTLNRTDLLLLMNDIYEYILNNVCNSEYSDRWISTYERIRNKC